MLSFRQNLHIMKIYYYENVFDLVDALKGSRGPVGSMDHPREPLGIVTLLLIGKLK